MKHIIAMIIALLALAAVAIAATPENDKGSVTMLKTVVHVNYDDSEHRRMLSVISKTSCMKTRKRTSELSATELV